MAVSQWLKGCMGVLPARHSRGTGGELPCAGSPASLKCTVVDQNKSVGRRLGVGWGETPRFCTCDATPTDNAFPEQVVSVFQVFQDAH